jgi:hypothetical protein
MREYDLWIRCLSDSVLLVDMCFPIGGGSLFGFSTGRQELCSSFF